MLKKLWLDEGGAVLSVELILLLVIVVIGISVGMVILRDAVVSEFQWIAAAVNSLDPGYQIAGIGYENAFGPAAYTSSTDASGGILGIGPGIGQIAMDTVVPSDAITGVPGIVAPIVITSP